MSGQVPEFPAARDEVACVADVSRTLAPFPCSEDISSQSLLDYRLLLKWFLDYDAAAEPPGSRPAPNCTYTSVNDQFEHLGWIGLDVELDRFYFK